MELLAPKNGKEKKNCNTSIYCMSEVRFICPDTNEREREGEEDSFESCLSGRFNFLRAAMNYSVHFPIKETPGTHGADSGNGFAF